MDCRPFLNRVLYPALPAFQLLWFCSASPWIGFWFRVIEIRAQIVIRIIVTAIVLIVPIVIIAIMIRVKLRMLHAETASRGLLLLGLSLHLEDPRFRV